MRKNILFMTILFGLILAFGVNGASPGTSTMTLPTSGSSITGTYAFTGTSELGGDNATFYYSTDSSTYVAICINRTVGLTTFTCTNTTSSISAISDLAGVSFRINVTNGTTTVDSNISTVSNVEVDNTAPSVNFLIGSQFVKSGSPIVADCSGSSDTVDTALTYLFTLTKADGSTVTQENANSSSGGVHTFSGSSTSPSGIGYSITCQVTDNVGQSTTSSASTFNVNPKDGKEEIVAEETKAKSKTTTYVIIFVITLILIIALILFVTQTDKK